MIISNIVKKEKMREVQSETLGILKEALVNSFGPMGSNTIISKENMLTKYTKDGHSILKDIVFQNVIERSVKSDLEDITRHIVKNIGDGTTSAVILSSIIFEKLKELEQDSSPYQLIRDFKEAVTMIKEEILTHSQEFNAEKAYRISLISTNGNTDVAENIRHIYDKFGASVFVDVSISNTTDSYIKEYDGMTLNTGYSDSAYINDEKKGVCSLRSPKIYMFEDPIDTPEMFGQLMGIIEGNIMKFYRQESTELVPTVIMAPMISRDMGSYITQIAEFLFKFKPEEKPPLLIITNTYQKEELTDIGRMCGCKPIKKYINKEQQQKDMELGLAPTPETILDFCGSADIVEADALKTKFVNPKLMFTEDGELSETFNTLVNFLQVELQRALESNEDNNVTGLLKRRINSLKANMVEYLVGGVSMSDRDAVRDLVEDSVLNCRAAANNGVGYGANFEGLRAAKNLSNRENKMINIIASAYEELVTILYSTCYSNNRVKTLVAESLGKGMPVNLKTGEFDGNVLCSITSDIIILDAIAQIISLMFTSNQFLCPTPVHNKYLMD